MREGCQHWAEERGKGGGKQRGGRTVVALWNGKHHGSQGLQVGVRAAVLVDLPGTCPWGK